MSPVDGLTSLVRDLVTDGVLSREAWHQWKLGKEDRLNQAFDYRRREDMPDVKQIVAPHFHSHGLIGLNYTPAAGISLHHHDGGWSPTLRLCRGITFDRDARVVAFPYPKFFNYGERLGNLGAGEPEITKKEDGHLLIIFRVGRGLYVKTRGDFDHASAKTGMQMVVDTGMARRIADMQLEDVTILCELIHPDTKVTVDYGGRKELILHGLYDNLSFQDLPAAEIRAAADELGIKAAEEVRMPIDDLIGVTTAGGNNAEGYVARWPDGHRVKFKYGGYVALNKEERAQRQGDRRPPPLAGDPKARRRVDKPVQKTAPWIRTSS